MDSMYLDNLDESVNDERKIVTYKWLSLTLGVHTNVAKQMLYQFVEKQRHKDCHDLTVTYIVSGVVAGQAGQPDTVKVAVVPEDALAAVKSEMKEVVSVHVYSVQRMRLNDLSLLYSSHYDTVKEHINDINKYSGIKCASAGLRSSADLENLKKGSAYQPPAEPPRPESKYKPQVKKEPLEGENKPVQSVNKVGSKASGGKNNQIASMFAQQAKKVVKKEKSEDKDESAKQKEETKSQAKNKRDISSFLSKGPSTKKQQPVKETKVKSASACPMKTNDSPRKSPARDSVKEDIEEVEVEEIKMQVDSPVKKQQKQSKIKAKNTKKTNKRKKEAEDESKTKRKRIMQLSDSESSDNEDTALQPFIMPPKRAKKNMMCLATKLKIIELKEKGKKNIEIVKELGVGESAVRKVLKKSDEIRQAAKIYGGGSFDNRSRTAKQNIVLIHMERYLAQYIHRKEKEGVSLDGRQIKNQAKVYYQVCLEKCSTPPTNPFKASSGWLNNFLKRKGFKNIKFTGERASADEETAKSFPSILKGLIKEGRYNKDQIYNLDETRFYYKTMPRSTYIANSQKQAKERKLGKTCFTLMLTLNVSGSLKMKPLVCHTAKHPRCFQNLKSMRDHPDFYWYQSGKGWMTTTIIRDWILNHFVPDARSKTETNEAINEIQADDVYGDEDIDEPLPDLPDLPPVTQVLTPEMTVTEFWRKFTVKQALELIHESWKDINKDTINHAWRMLVPHLCSEKPGEMVQQVCEAERAVLAAARGVAGCEEVTEAELRELIQEESEPADVTMERIDREDEQIVISEETHNQPENQPQEMTMHNLSNILLGVMQLKEIITVNETDRFKAEEMNYTLDKILLDYDIRHRDGVNERRQSLITKFLRPNPATIPNDHDAAPSTSLEPVVTTADHAADSTSTDLQHLDFEGFEAAANSYRSRVSDKREDSESEDEEAEEDAEAADWAALSPTPPASSPPATLDTARIESDSEEDVPPTPQEGKNGRARKRKLVNKTFTDEDGFLVTKKEYEYVDDSGEEDAADTTTTTTTSESPGVSQSSSTSATKTSPKKTPVSPQNKTKNSPKKKTGAKSSKKSHTQDTKKQSNIMSFFSKK
ncbi:hypothetical protein Pmani_029172 [Petrolisthes manimaculis]|uniref:DNA polymerase delta subunit 3 n=1 Tax=Petrolisthes manimaculis TaxID=1843537 RepID=A0AAE1TU51_9EUCA|nr:hypothetical protein Pmani_029172 [Petrolisthes manimaculis]